MPVPATKYSIEQGLAFNRAFSEHVDEMLGFFKDEIIPREELFKNGVVTKMIYSISNLSPVQREELRRRMECYLDVPSPYVQMPISDTIMDERTLIINAKSLESYHVSIILFFRHDYEKPFNLFCNAKTRIYFNINVRMFIG